MMDWMMLLKEIRGIKDNLVFTDGSDPGFPLHHLTVLWV
jgi:hypothetical protein